MAMATDTIPDVDDQAEQIDADNQEQSEAVLLDQRKREHYEQIRELNTQVIEARGEWASAKEDAAEAKKSYDGLVSQLQLLIGRGPDMQGKLEFPDDEEATPDDAWRDAQIVDALALSVGQYEKLEEAGITTVGQLEDLRAGDGLDSIKGFGQATIDKIEDQIIEWLDENRDRFGEAVEADPEEDYDDQDED
jgi:DNA-directed RNA polymerase alpha subunit